ncbi:FecR domain-containing protein [Chitinophaga sp. MM2321]|uniref:FecR family protein n=1 Tax=Chitinophaga sp. MM2321 TaxID=3137178 RepID=UPI0032D59130
MELDQQIKILLEKDNWTDEERRWLLTYLDNTPAGELKSYLLQRFREEEGMAANFDHALSQRLLDNIHRQIAPVAGPLVVPFYRRAWKGIAVAAMIVLLFGAGYFILSQQQTQKRGLAVLPVSRFGTEVAPGGNKAKLVLGNGQEILLEETADGTIAAQGNEHIHKENAALMYDHTSGHTAGATINTLSTPNGGQYKVVLSDGTKVWLNAASALQYPAVFNGAAREVLLTGEAYFEVAKDADKPFLVTVNDIQVQVLGTHFNVKAYTNDRQVTTLLEGAVRVKKGAASVVLAPGQQASPDRQDGTLRMTSGDPELALAWKNGLLAFKNDALQDVMHSISRWYDVDVVYEADVDKEAIHVSGAMRKQEYLSRALEILELTAGIHFKVTGRTVTVSR